MIIEINPYTTGMSAMPPFLMKSEFHPDGIYRINIDTDGDGFDETAGRPPASVDVRRVAQMSRRGSVGHRSEAQAGQLSNGTGARGGEQAWNSSFVGGVNKVRNRSWSSRVNS